MIRDYARKNNYSFVAPRKKSSAIHIVFIILILMITALYFFWQKHSLGHVQRQPKPVQVVAISIPVKPIEKIIPKSSSKKIIKPKPVTDKGTNFQDYDFYTLLPNMGSPQTNKNSQ